MSRNRKLSYKWLGPYRVQKAIPEKGTYILEEFDGTTLSGTYAGNRLKKFIEREGFYTPAATNHNESNEGSEGSDDGNELGGSQERTPKPEMEPRRSNRLRNAQNEDLLMSDVPTYPRRNFVIVPPTLTAEQRREYVRYKEDEDGNLI
jgi:hypothetical protein